MKAGIFGMQHAANLSGYFRRLVRLFDFLNIDYRFFDGYSFPPQSVCLILSERCNLRCRMCDIGYKNAHAGESGSQLVQSITSGSGEMTLTDWLRLIDDLARFTPQPFVLLTGTEPLLYPHVREVIEHIAEAGLRLHITTNGTLLESHAPWLASACQTPSALDITVSLDGLEDIHDAIRGLPGTFARAIRGIEAFTNFSNELCGQPASINITCTVSDSNCRSLESFVDGIMARRLPVASITFNHLWFKDASIVRRHNEQCGKAFSIAVENIRGVDIKNIDMQTASEQIQAVRRRYRGKLRIHQMPELSIEEAAAYYSDPCRFVFYDRCTALWRNVAVTPKGNVIASPLCFLPQIGTVKDEPFSKLWNGLRARSLRRRLKQAKSFPACARCCMLFGSKPKYYKLKDWLG
jgi:MoaA/NifB/PqqE/SkfB family radical SAM enzyme